MNIAIKICRNSTKNHFIFVRKIRYTFSVRYSNLIHFLIFFTGLEPPKIKNNDERYVGIIVYQIPSLS